MTQSAYGRVGPMKARKDNNADRAMSTSLVQNHRLDVEQAASLESVAERHTAGDPRLELVTEPGSLAARPRPLADSRSAPFRFMKRAVDVVGAIGLTLVFAPLILIVAILIQREGGNVLYRHRRVGRNGKMFECLKFRTMVPDADRILHELLANNEKLKAEWIQNHKLKDDPRVTRIGRFLRRTSLDELPQFWNVLCGDMSLVGPRPIVREELLRYGRSAPLYLAVKPGVTGLWQTAGRNDTDYRRRVAMDVYYVRNPSMRLDLLILLRTARLILRGDGAY
jgi:exopolysaccharide production protein ExoY